MDTSSGTEGNQVRMQLPYTGDFAVTCDVRTGGAYVKGLYFGTEGEGGRVYCFSAMTTTTKL